MRRHATLGNDPNMQSQLKWTNCRVSVVVPINKSKTKVMLKRNHVVPEKPYTEMRLGDPLCEPQYAYSTCTICMVYMNYNATQKCNVLLQATKGRFESQSSCMNMNCQDSWQAGANPDLDIKGTLFGVYKRSGDRYDPSLTTLSTIIVRGFPTMRLRLTLLLQQGMIYHRKPCFPF